MKIPATLFQRCSTIGLLLLAMLLGNGCQHSSTTPGVNTSTRFVFPGETNGATAQVTDVQTSISTGNAASLRVGEKITIIFSGLPQPQPQPHEQRIRADGTITLRYGIKLTAAGKTPGELEDEIHKAYVPNYYAHLTPIVKAEERSFSVGGEVKFPNRQPYTDRITVLRAIQSAGDFTDFANRKKIKLIRATGEQFEINWNDAVRNHKFDLEVFPGDQIIVPKRII